MLGGLLYTHNLKNLAVLTGLGRPRLLWLGLSERILYCPKASFVRLRVRVGGREPQRLASTVFLVPGTFLC